jgi:CHAT domain-containing protein
LAGLYHDLALFYSRRADKNQELIYLQKSLEAGRIAGKIVDKKLQLQNLSAFLLRANVQISEALIEEAFALGMQLLSECRQDADRQSALNEIHDFFEALLFYESKKIAGKALDKKQFDRLFSCFERGKSLLLAKSLSETDALQAAAVPDSLQLKYKDLKNNAVYFEQQWLAAEFSKDTAEIDYLRNEAGHFAEALEKMQAFLKKEYPQFSFSWAANTALTKLSELRSLLKTDELLLDYFVGKQHSFLLAISKDELIFKALDSSSMQALPVFLAQFYQPELLESNLPKALSDYLQYGTKISEALLPTAAQLKGIRQLTIIPDGILSYLPFEALLSEKVAADTAAFDNLPYLLRCYSIRYAYNVLLLQRQQTAKSATASHSLSAFAPYYASETEEHLPLPGAIAELNMLQAKYEGRFFIDEKIAKTQLVKELKRAPEFLHLAMHAFAPDSSEAFLLLSKQENEEEGRLWMRELMLLPLEQTKLIVLSACQTGMGSFRRGEGLMSLGRGFAYAGAGAMLTTLWPLHDHAAEQLMRSFYSYLDKGYDKAEALRLAKLDFIAEAGALSAHPVFWASPLFWGNEAALQLPKAKAKVWPWVLWGVGLLGLLGASVFVVRRRYLSVRR